MRYEITNINNENLTLDSREVAYKMIGTKGAQFTVTYINKIEKMIIC
ncbi:hypothetical protein [Clostridium sp. Marseille-Q2269]|nr:hypothetical protein [Clostridium sp. Marseille-Q2269]